MKPVAGYYRVSVARDDMKAPELYEEEITRYCAYRGVTLGAMYKDIDASGYRGSRPRQGLEDLKLHHLNYSAVIVPKLARFGRSVKDLVALFELFDRSRVPLVFLDMNIDTSTSQGRLLRHIMAAFAEYESDVKADYARSNHRLARSKGLAWGRAPFGYILDRTSHTFEISAPEAAVVRLIFEGYAEGGSQAKIADRLNETGTPGPGGEPWCSRQLGRILDNPSYAALCVLDDALVPARWAPIVAMDTWERVRELRLANPHRGLRLRGGRGGPYLLTGLLYCGYCGRKLTHRTVKNKRNGIYLCVEPGGRRCPGGSVSTSRADAFITDRFLDRCRFTIEGEARGFGDSVHAWEGASIEQRRALLALAIREIVVAPWDGPEAKVTHGHPRHLRIEWHPGVPSIGEVELVAQPVAESRGRRNVSRGRHEMMRAVEAATIQRHHSQRSEKAQAYFSEWAEVQARMRDEGRRDGLGSRPAPVGDD